MAKQQKKKQPEPEPEEFHWDRSVANFITIRYSPTEDQPLEMDLGSIEVYTALSIVKACWEELETRVPDVGLRFNGAPLELD